MRKKQRQMLRQLSGRATVLVNRVNSKGNTPTLETTKQDKKREIERETKTLQSVGQAKQPHTGERVELPTPEPTRFGGVAIPSKFSDWCQDNRPSCPDSSSVTTVLRSQFN